MVFFCAIVNPMRIIDANTGLEVQVGETFNNVNGTHTLVSVEEKMFSARGTFQSRSNEDAYLPGIVKVQLQVRYMHPGYFFQKVAFIPS